MTMTDNQKNTAERLQEIGKSAYASIVEMVAALNCDYELLESLADERSNIEYDIREGNHEEIVAAIPKLEAWERENGIALDALRLAANDCKDRDDAEQRIQEDALSVRVRGDWYSPGSHDLNDLRPFQFELLLTTGGPAVRIMGELDEYRQPVRAWLEVQDWFQPWTQYMPADQDVLLDYARCFYYGER